MTSQSFENKVCQFMGETTQNLKDIRCDIVKLNNQFSEYTKTTNDRITVLEIWKTDIVAKMTILIGAFSITMSILWSYIKQKLNL